jgi:hypothetical protein
MKKKGMKQCRKNVFIGLTLDPQRLKKLKNQNEKGGKGPPPDFRG